ncbi:MAG: hypothetical protein ACI9SC_003409 [Gammaproteobacteria bacterium]|jgi:hypothetical protein
MELSLPWHHFRAQPSLPRPSKNTAIKPAPTDAGIKILCWKCHEMVTVSEEAINQNGSHIHNGTNPAGHSFRFACYQNATGCSELGPASLGHSWFPGYCWQVAVCNACLEQLGWLFTGESRFYGLITDRIISSDHVSK